MDLPTSAALSGTPTPEDRFTAAYTQYRPMVRSVILGKLRNGDTHLAEDLTQNTFLALYRYLDRIDMSRDVGGLLRVMAGQSISHWYRAMRNSQEQPSDLGHWRYANREMDSTAAGYYTPAATGFRTAGAR